MGLLPGLKNSTCCWSMLVAMVVSVVFSPKGFPGENLEYSRDVRPILADKCFACHGPDSANRQADLRLDEADGAYAALAGDETLHAIVPGDPSASEVFKRITTTDEDLRMPPVDSNLKLTPQEIETLKKWIEQGAIYQQHWSFIPPVKVTPPALGNDPWIQNEIDALVLEKMREHGLSPNPPATREQLLRRVTFDLTGLPPTLEELDAFLADDSPDAFEKVVDRLLASQHYGERMTAEWLDVARYSDSYGFQVDKPRTVWQWRDWVLRAFNRDLPYDEFLTQQIAGDLLPNASQEEILATTFCRLHPQEAEGGSIPEEYRVGYVADRVQTFGTAFLGLTLECCKCHDHKYDPISQREFYQLASFFDNIDEAGLYSFFTNSVPTPTLLLTDDASEAKLKEQQQQIDQRESELTAVAASREEAFRAWLSTQPELPETLPGQIAHLDFEHVAKPNQVVPGVQGNAVQLTGDDPVNLEVGNFHRYEPFSVSLWMKTPDTKERAVIFHRSRAWTDAGSRGYELLLLDGHLSAALVHFDPGNSVRIHTREPLPLNSWQHVVVTYDGSSRAEGLKIFLNGTLADVVIDRDKLTKEITGGGGDNITIGERFRDHGFSGGLVDEFRVFARELEPIEVAHLHDGQALKAALESSVDAPPQEHPLWRYYLKNVDEDYRQGLANLQSARQQRVEFIETIPEIMVMREMPEPKPTYLLTRGEYTARAEEVSSDTPKSLPPFPEEMPRNRLGLAKWLTDPNHPLTARVAVNRYWQLIFGRGLVATTEDMGNQGALPSHPELLDWLARDFVDNGWSVKALLKKMVLSSTYQQSAIVPLEKERVDPENVWLTRAMSERFPAEMLRDNALLVSGLLVERLGGPPVRPYEVEVAFKPMDRDKGEGLYRRSVYTYWNRTGPAPVMMTLDAAKRDVCQVRRERTLSPLQPLVMLNAPQFVEAARMLAERVLKQHPDDVDSALTDMFRWTTSRRPNTDELQVLKKLYTQHHADFTANPEQAIAFLSVGDYPRDESLDVAQSAALAGVANLLLNYDDCVFRR